MGLLINTDGTTKNVAPKNGKSFSVDELQEFVGGDFEMVRLLDGRYLIVNDMGRLIDLPRNDRASGMYDGVIVGNVLLPNEGEME